jgi:DNA topoisomerase-1
VIVESPAKCKKIEQYLGSGYKCVASFGHIRELDGLKSIDISNNFSPSYKLIRTKSQQISKIKKEIQDSSEVILATDDDREGESIAWHICQTFKLNVKTTKRILFNEITKSALTQAVRNPKTINMDIVYAQQARQVLDLLVGYKVSPMLWKFIKQEDKTSLSAGRCQSPALKLVFDNQTEIEKSVPKTIYNTNGYFTKLILNFSLNKEFEERKEVETFLEESVNFDHVYTINEPKNVTKNPPSPFITSTLQQATSNEFHISPKETMSICQKLYEDGYITYMRTDSKTYSKEFIDKSKSYIEEQFGENYVHPNIYRLCNQSDSRVDSSETQQPTSTSTSIKNKKGKEDKVKPQEAHEAIRPTDIKLDELPNNYENKEKKIYKLIWRNTLESCMSPATYKSITANVTAPFNHIYSHVSEQVVFPGWKMVNGYEINNKSYTFIQSLKNGSIIDYKKITSNVSIKDMKSHYSEARLVQLLEEKGIGRPSTYSSIIDKIQKRGYVNRQNIEGKKIKCIDFELIEDELSEKVNERIFGNEKNKLVITPIGIEVCDFLYKYYDPLFKYDYTKYMEDVLDTIANGNKTWYELCNECYTQINQLTNAIQPTNANDENPDSECNQANMKPKYTRPKPINKKLGKYNNLDLILKKGKYGLYVVWGENKKSINDIKKNEDDITYEDVVNFLDKPFLDTYLSRKQDMNDNEGNYRDNCNTVSSYQKSKEETNDKLLVRYLNNELSIRNSKYGDYIFYKTNAMFKPKFLKIKGYNGDYKRDSIESIINWIKETYEI